MNTTLEERYITVSQIIGDPKAQPPIPGILPIGKSTWWKKVKEGEAPQGIKLGSKTTVWRLSEVYKYAEEKANGDAK